MATGTVNIMFSYFLSKSHTKNKMLKISIILVIMNNLVFSQFINTFNPFNSRPTFNFNRKMNTLKSMFTNLDLKVNNKLNEIDGILDQHKKSLNSFFSQGIYDQINTKVSPKVFNLNSINNH